MKRLATLLFSVLLLSACMSAPPAAIPAPDALFADGAFKPPSEEITAQELFTLTPAMLSYMRSTPFEAHLRAKGAEQGLVDALYQKGELSLEYDSTLTRTAAQTFEAKSGNCLSLVIMTAAFAKQLNMQVQYQNVIVDETWSRNAGLYFASSHVNITIGRRAHDFLRGYDPQRVLTVDFIPSFEAAKYRTLPLDETTIVAMYMNNRAAEALATGRPDDAYWWARESIKQHPQYLSAFNTLGVVYQRRGDNAMAELVFREALLREPNNLIVKNNLVPVLAALGKTDESHALAAEVARVEPYPPFHFYELGMKAIAAGDNQRAKEMFQREVARSPYYDEFHFWLAVAHHRLGEAAPAREQMALAARTSTTTTARDAYNSKLATLKAGARAR
jgi:Tfp pilus assembly protein PilF